MKGNDTSNDSQSQEVLTLNGILLAVLYRSDNSLFVVAKFDMEGELFPVAAVGEMASPAVGERYELTGAWAQHPKYGRQFRWTRCDMTMPATREGIARYLSSGFINGIGPMLAGRIADKFGKETLAVFSDEIERLLEVEGIGPKKLDRIRASWAEQQGMAAIMLFLRTHGIGPGRALAIHRAYGEDAVPRVRGNPYLLVQEVEGIGFREADRIARSLGISADAPSRLKAGVVFTMREASRSDGHSYLPLENCVGAAAALLEVEAGEIRHALHDAVAEGVLILDSERVYTPELHRAERDIVASMLRLSARPAEAQDPLRIEEALRDAERAIKVEFAPLQVEAIHKAIAGPVTVLTGGPGTGKTTAVAGMIAAAGILRLRVSTCAPTGRAARRLSEVTGGEAKTIHRLLEFDPSTGFFRRGSNEPLETDFVIVDELSMVDAPLMAALLNAVPDHARVALVGDADQLPSVGPGNILRDLISSGCAETVALQLIHRQAEHSRIVTNSHRVRGGFMPVFERDTFFVETPNSEAIAETVREIVTERIPRELGYNPVESIQVLSPMYSTPAGVNLLNRTLRKALNPKGRLILAKGEAAWHVGDKVMQTRNNYEKDVFNGDIGVIVEADDEETQARVRFYGRDATFSFDELEELAHAYAITIHKSQGSEYDVVVLPMTLQHRIMLQRNLLYTAMTRARKLLVFVGQRAALETAVHNDRITRRYSGLEDALKGVFR